MKNRLNTVINFVFLGILLSLSSCGTQNEMEFSRNEDLEDVVAEGALDFKQVSFGSSKTLSYTIGNASGVEIELGSISTLNVNSFNSSLYTYSIGNCKGNLKKFETCEIEITFSPAPDRESKLTLDIPFQYVSGAQKTIKIQLDGEGYSLAPQITIINPLDGAVVNIANGGLFAVSGTCDEAGASVSFSHGAGSAICDGTIFNANLDLTSLGQGSFNLTASISDSGGNSTTSADKPLIKDSIAPNIAITSPANGSIVNLSNEGSLLVSGTCDEAGQSLSFSHGAGSAICNGTVFSINLDLTGVGQGAFNLTASLSDAAGNSTASVDKPLTKDSIAPNITLTSPVDGSVVNITNEGSFIISGTCDSPGQAVSFSHGIGSINCVGSAFNGNLDLTGVGEGAFNLTVSISDVAGNSATSVDKPLTKDSIAPSIAITSPADGTIVNLSNEGSFTVSGTCDEAGQSLSFSHGTGSAICNGTSFSANLDLTSLGQGVFNLTVSISDVAGNSATSVDKPLTKDSVAPSIAITSPAEGSFVNLSNEGSFAVSGTCSEAGQSLSFSHGTGSATCNGTIFSTNLDLTSLGQGSFNLTASISDSGGNSTTSINRPLTKDSIAPSIAVTSPANGFFVNIVNQGSFAVSGTCDEAGGAVNFSHGTGSATCNGTSFNANLGLTSLGQGAFNLRVSISDSGGNSTTSADKPLTKDSIAPSIAITSPVDGTIVNLSNEGSFAVSGTCDEAGQSLSFSHGTGSAICNGTIFSTNIDLTSLGQGAFNLTASISDSGGNSTTSANKPLVKDTGLPSIAITLPADGSFINITNQGSFAVSGTCDEAGGAVNFSHGTGSAICNGTGFSINLDLTSLGQGAFNLTASISDSGGNSTTSADKPLTKDNIAPNIAITSPVDGTIVNLSNEGSFTVSGTCDEAGQSLSFSHGTGSAICNGINFNTNLDLSILDQGAFNLTASISDVAGNSTTSADKPLTKDSIAPSIAITSPANGSVVNITNEGSFLVSGTCSEAGQSLSFSHGTGSAICNGINFNVNLDLTSLGQGAFNLTVSLSDAGGNATTSADKPLTKDNIAPNIAITSPVDGTIVNLSNEGSFTVSGTCDEAGQAINFSHGTGSVNCDGANFNGTINLTSVGQGSFNLTASLSDVAGNSTTSTVKPLTKDSIAPSIAITSPANGSIVNLSNEGSFTVSGTCSEAGQSLSFSHGTGSAICNGTNFSTNIDLTSLGQGAFNLTVSLSDSSGNSTTSINKPLVKDTGLPSIAITSPADGSFVNIVNQGSFAVSGTCDEAGEAVSFSHGTGSAICNGTIFSTNLDLTGVGQGAFNLTASISDSGGNSTTSADKPLTKDSIAPSIAITSPADGAIVNLSNEGSLLVSGTCDEAGQSLSFSHGTGSATCNGTIFSANLDLTSLGQGAFNLTVSLSDSSGNSTTSAAKPLMKDSVSPNIAITSPVNGSVVSIANQVSFAVSGTCDEAGQSLSFSHGTGSATCNGTNFSTNLDLTSLGQGAFNLTASISDSSGNATTSAAKPLMKDSVSPNIAITSPANGSVVNLSNEGSFTVSGTCNETGGAISFSHGVSSINCDGVNFNGNLDLTGLGQGVFNLTASISDSAGNSTTSVNKPLTKDSIAPSIAITSPVNGSVVSIANQVSFAVSGTCDEAGQSLSFSHGTGSATCNGTNFSTNLDLTSLGQGAFNLTASISDSSGNATTSAAKPLMKDSVSPNIAITSPVNGSVVNLPNEGSFTVSGTCDEAGQAINFSHGMGSAICNGTIFNVNLDLTSLGQGAFNLTASISDSGGNSTTSINKPLTKDSIAPSIAITSPADGTIVNLSNEGSFLVSGTCDEAGQSLSFSDGTGSAICNGTNFSANLDLTSLGQGVFNLTASISDAAGNSTISAGKSLTKDSIAPSIAITSPADGTYVVPGNQGAFTVSGTCDEAGQSLSFSHGTGSATCNGTLFNVNLDLTGLGQGAFNLTASISDSSGNSTTSAAKPLTKDSVAPNIAIISPVNGSFINIANQGSFTVSGTCDGTGQAINFSHGTGSINCDGVNFNVNLDLTGVGQGAFNLTAGISDAAGNSTTSAGKSLTKDSVAPNIAITSPANGSVVNLSNEGSFAVSGTCDGAGQTVGFSHGTGSAICNGTIFSTNLDLTGVGQGAFNLTASISDAAGNATTSAAKPLTKDSVAPSIAIILPADGSIVNLSNEGSFAISGTCSEAGQSLSFSHGAGSATCNGTIFSVNLDLTSLGQGVFNLTASISDAAGNATTSAAKPLTKDSVAPSIAITSPVNGSIVNIVNQGSFAVSGTCNSSGQAVSFSHGTGSINCDGFNFNGVINLTSLGQGAFNLTASISDAAGNSTTSAVKPLTKDSVAPSIAITSPIDGAVVNIANQGSFAISGTCNSSGQAVGFSHGTGSINCDGFNFNGVINLTSVGQGAFNLTASISDAAGNSTTSAVKPLTKDSVAPSIAITSPIDGAVVNIANQGSFAISGTCNTPGQAVSFSHGTGSINCVGSAFNGNLDLTGAGQGAFNLTASISDSAGNSTTSAAKSLTKDSVAPIIAITSPVNGSFVTLSNEGSFAVSGTCDEAGQSLSFSHGTGSATCNGTIFSINLDLTSLGQGAFNLTVDISDSAGNSTTSAGKPLTKDSVAPSIAITSPVNDSFVNLSNEGSFAVSGTCDEAGGAVSFSHGTGSTICNGTIFSANLDLTSLGQGSFNLTASISDGGGNSATSANKPLTKDSFAPTVSIGAPSIGAIDFFTSVDFLITYSGATTVILNPSGVNITGDSTDCSAAVANGTTATPTVTISGCSAASGSIQISIDAGTATDVAGNASLASALSAAVLVSNIPPGDPFVSRWTFTAGKSFTIPLKSGLNYNFTVDWGDASPASTVTSYSDVDKTHVYTAGTYTMTITGVCEGFQNSGVFKNDLIEVVDLGVVNWKNLSQAFLSNVNLINVSGGDVSQVTNMSFMFQGAAFANPDTSGWDTSNVTNMTSMFSAAKAANPDTSNWNTSKVTNMSHMFFNTIVANPDTSGWDTSQVIGMTAMFWLSTATNPDTSSWNTSNVTSMSLMFANTGAANPDTSGWDTSKVLNMSSMFASAVAAAPNTSAWNTSIVTNMRSMFYNAVLANPVVSGWGTSNVTSMREMFYDAHSANPDTSSWDTSQVTDMFGMFRNTVVAVPDTSSWDTSKVINMGMMFYNAAIANPNTSTWITSSVTSMIFMFFDTAAANPDTSSWNTSNVTNMSGMFYLAAIAAPDTSSWDTSKVTNMANMFTVAVAANPDTSGWNTSSVINMSSMFSQTTVADPDTSSWDTSKVTNMSLMFFRADMANPNTGSWNTSSVTNMNSIFWYAAVANPNTSSWNTSMVTNMSNMFANTTVANPDTSGWDTSKVTIMSNMFANTTVANPDTSSWDTSKVINMGMMFNNAAIANPNISSWDTSKVTIMSSMFNSATAFDQDISSWNTNLVTACTSFELGTSPLWTLAEKPTFASCAPGY